MKAPRFGVLFLLLGEARNCLPSVSDNIGFGVSSIKNETGEMRLFTVFRVPCTKISGEHFCNLLRHALFRKAFF